VAAAVARRNAAAAAVHKVTAAAPELMAMAATAASAAIRTLPISRNPFLVAEQTQFALAPVTDGAILAAMI
jgi:hypothetical protein